MSQILNKEQQLRLAEMLRTALQQGGATLQTMLGGSISVLPGSSPQSQPGLGIWLGLNGALEGGVHLVLPEQMAEALVKRLSAGMAASLLDEIARSALMELGNILASVFVAHFDQTRGLRTLPTPPQLSFVPQAQPRYAYCYRAELAWSQCDERGTVMIGLQQRALELLLQ